LVLVIIGGRWMLPRGTITRDQLSALLLEYVGIAVDILELFGSFEKDEMSTNHTVTVIILSVYSWSLLQFTFSSTALNEEKEEADEEEEKKQIEDELVYSLGILAGIFMQDGPFLAVRLYLIFSLGIADEKELFFAGKNIVTIALLLYRLFAI
ncbi:predicted protein, partial [Nematostella vectensis]